MRGNGRSSAHRRNPVNRAGKWGGYLLVGGALLVFPYSLYNLAAHLLLSRPSPEARLDGIRKTLEEWRVEEQDWRIYDDYDQAMPVVERYLRDTNHADSPWTIVEIAVPTETKGPPADMFT